MTRPLSYAILILFAAVSIVLAAARPEWVSNENKFLHGFVNHEFLNLLGVILAITLASVANIHLEFNKIEERYRSTGLDKSRRNIKKAAYWLIGLFLAGVVLVTIKPLMDNSPASQGLANMGALFIVLWHVLILIALTQLVFAIPPDIRSAEDRNAQAPPKSGNGGQP